MKNSTAKPFRFYNQVTALLSLLVVCLLALPANLQAIEDPPGCSLANGGQGNTSQGGINFNIAQAHVGDCAPVFPSLGMANLACRAINATGTVYIATGLLTNFLINVNLDPGTLVSCPNGNSLCQPGPYNVCITPAMVGAGVSSPNGMIPGVAKAVLAVENGAGTVQTGATPTTFADFHTALIGIVTPCIQVVKQCAYPANSPTCFSAGAIFDFTGYVTNCGDIRLTNVTILVSGMASLTVFSNAVPALPAGGPYSLSPGAVLTYYGSYALLAQEACAGRATNTVTVRGTDITIIGVPRASVTNSITSSCDICMPIVSNNNDSGAGSLRQVIASAVGYNCPVTFAPNVTGTITLTTGELLIGKNLIISGPTTAGVTVSGNNVSRVFHLTSGTVSISNLTIANGNTLSILGGGIYTEPGNTLILNNCTLSHNVATNNGNGGGIAAYGTVLATNCTFSGNQASTGGGLFNYGATLILRNCTVGSNSAVFGGGVYNYAVAGTTTIVESTIIAGNSVSVIADVSGAFTSQGYNLIGKTNGSSGFGVNHDQVGSGAAPLDPLLGPLTDNGGPTLTLSLTPGSPAIDKGNSFGLTTDERGAPRPFDFSLVTNASGGDGSDIGAYELNPPVLSVARAANNVVLSWPTYDTGYTLEAKTNLNPSINWSNVAGTPAIVAGQFTITNSATPGNKFYRLKSQ